MTRQMKVEEKETDTKESYEKKLREAIEDAYNDGVAVGILGTAIPIPDGAQRMIIQKLYKKFNCEEKKK